MDDFVLVHVGGIRQVTTKERAQKLIDSSPKSVGIIGASIPGVALEIAMASKSQTAVETAIIPWSSHTVWEDIDSLIVLGED